MNLKQIENEALHLSENERAELVQTLLLSFENTVEQRTQDSLIDTIKQRADDLNNGVVQAVSADEVRRKALAIIN